MGIGKGDLACMVSMHEGEYQGINNRDEDVTLKLDKLLSFLGMGPVKRLHDRSTITNSWRLASCLQI